MKKLLMLVTLAFGVNASLQAVDPKTSQYIVKKIKALSAELAAIKAPDVSAPQATKDAYDKEFKCIVLSHLVTNDGSLIDALLIGVQSPKIAPVIVLTGGMKSALKFALGQVKETLSEKLHCSAEETAE